MATQPLWVRSFLSLTRKILRWTEDIPALNFAQMFPDFLLLRLQGVG